MAGVSHVATAPHECEGNFIFTENGLSPYWTTSKLLTAGFNGYADEVETDVGGEEWTLSLSYQKSGIRPRLQDDIGGDRLYEFRISATGCGERKANFLIQPRFPKMRHYETGERISTPFDHLAINEGINVRFAGSNLEPDEFLALLPQFVQILALEGGVHVNPAYFASSVHEMSNITTYERYVRLNRTWSEKVVGRAGIMQRLLHLCATEKGSKFEYRANNEEIIGYNHRAILPKQDAQRLITGHRYGKQFKHYHPKHVRTTEQNDPLYHPKIGVHVKKSLTGHAVAWDDRRQLQREVNETLINLLYWSDVPVQADRTTYVPDTHFTVREADEPVSLAADPTPEMEANQETLLVTVLRDLCDSDVEVLEMLVTDGAGQHPRDLARKTDHGISTIYRVFDRLQGIVRNEGARISFVSKKFEQEIAALVDSIEYQIENAADRAAAILNLETRQAASSAFQKWCTTYAAKIVEVSEEGQHTLRIDTVFSRLKSSPNPRIQDVLREAIDAWHKDGRDPLDLLNATVKWRTGPETWEVGMVKSALE